MDDIKILLGKRIKELRKAKNWTQEYFAEKLNIDQRSLSAIECGLNFPTKNFVKIAQVLNIELKELFDFEHIEKTEENMRSEAKHYIEKLDFHDLKIVFKLLKSMN
ncbi:helix-turn-helix transcriptional regulator [bacterium]|nr:helix-turn-helix transcriptional regulator [bacterium]